MPFGFMEAIGLLGTVSKLLSPQQAPAQPTYQSSGMNKEEFKNLFKEALAESKQDSSATADAKTDLQSLPELFDYLDSNKDGTLSKSEFEKLDDLLAMAKSLS